MTRIYFMCTFEIQFNYNAKHFKIMKASKEHLSDLKNRISEFFAKLGVSPEQLSNVYKAENLSETRFLWDIFWETKIHKEQSFRESNYTDKHIQTLIKKAIKETFDFSY